MTTKKLSIKDIDRGKQTQPRKDMSTDVIDEYQRLIEEGIHFPPVDVVSDGEHYWLVDGFHRVEAMMRAGWNHVDANVTKGTLQSARWACLAANQTHGLHRSNADKQRAVRMALEMHPEMSDRMIAEHVGVSQPMVTKQRSGDKVYHLPSDPTHSDAPSPLPAAAPDVPDAEPLESKPEPKPETRIGRDGKSYPVKPRKRKDIDTNKDEDVLTEAPIQEEVDTETPAASTRTRRPVGMIRAHEAINILNSIPDKDPCRDEGLRTVARWIKHNQ